MLFHFREAATIVFICMDLWATAIDRDVKCSEKMSELLPVSGLEMLSELSCQ